MDDSGFMLSVFRDGRIAPHATASSPAWLWNPYGGRIIWANATGAAIFGAPDCGAIAGRVFSEGQAPAAQVARLAATLASGAAPRLEMLRGFGGGLGRALLCACSRVTIDYQPAILIVATQPAGPTLPPGERVRRLLTCFNGAVAAFAPDGALMAATKPAQAMLAGRNALTAIGAASVAANAHQHGHAEGISDFGPLSLERIGSGTDAFFLARFTNTTPLPRPAPPSRGSAQATAVSETNTVAAAGMGPDASVATPSPADRRHPLRFVWQMDADGRFNVGSDEFVALVGSSIVAGEARAWNDIKAETGLDPDGLIDSAFASRDTFSGVTLKWPVAQSADRLDVELSGLPVFDRDRNFRGYRGFGVCRDVERIASVLSQRDAEPQAQKPDASTEPSPAAPVIDERPALTLVPASPPNVVPFPSAGVESKPVALNPLERSAFNELAKQLSARLRESEDGEGTQSDETLAKESKPAAPATVAATPIDERPVLERLPAGVLVYRHDRPIFANGAFLEWAGHDNLLQFIEAGGIESLFLHSGEESGARADGGQPLFIDSPRRGKAPIGARLFTIPWDGASAMALLLMPEPDKNRRDDVDTILDAITDGIFILDGNGRVLSSNHGAQTLFGQDAETLSGQNLTALLSPESRPAALTYLQQAGPSTMFNDGQEVGGLTATGARLPLFMTIGRLADSEDRFCAVFRDLTPWKKAEDEMRAAKRQAERTSAAKSEFLAKVSHEIRNPLNTIIGFSDVMMAERFGSVGNDRYREYLKDIHAAGETVIALLDDLVDLSKIETGKLDLNFDRLNLNDLAQETVAVLQPQANRERIIIRTSLPDSLPQVVADARSVRQIIANLLANSIKLTDAGGQVILSTAVNDDGEVVLRVRDTSTMTEKDLANALEPFRQLAIAARTGTGLGLPLTKALAEANRASFSIRNAAQAGTLVEIAFPVAPLAAQ